ncbi:unnamed protein product, partial [Rotaria sp. Silwood1]
HGYTGINCETATSANLCLQGNPACLNGGVCTLSGNAYRCSCPTGFTGQYCETALVIPHPAGMAQRTKEES